MSSKVKVLIVEDEKSILNLGSKILKALGYNVLAARTPGDALAQTEAHPGPIHLLVTDVVMPEMNGKDLADRLRGRKRGLVLHSRIVLGMTMFLLLVGAVLYYVFERDNTLRDLGEPARMLNAFFQSVTPRTAGFNVLPQARLSVPSKALTLVLMFTGAGPGSTAGGVKVTTMFLVVLAVLRGTRANGTLDVSRRQIVFDTVARAQLAHLAQDEGVRHRRIAADQVGHGAERALAQGGRLGSVAHRSEVSGVSQAGWHDARMRDWLRRKLPSEEVVRSRPGLRWMGPLLRRPWLWQLNRRPRTSSFPRKPPNGC